MSSKAFFNRSYHLTITDELTKKSRTYTELDIKFSVKRPVGPCKVEAHISILGLSAQTINELTAVSIMAPVQAFQKKKRITLTAGYEGNETAIFTGYITHAVCDPPPNMWLHITAYTFSEDVQEVFKCSLKNGTKLKDAFEYAAKLLGYTPKWEYTGFNKDVAGWTICGNRTNIIQCLNELASWYVFVDGQFLYAVDKHIKYRQSAVSGSLDRKNGLIRVLDVNYYGATFQTWLRNDVPLARFVKLVSELIPSASGVYNIYEKEYRGHFRGDEWFTIYSGKRLR